MHKVLPIEKQLQSFEPLLKTIVKGFYIGEYEEKEDALQEARISAYEAIVTYNSNYKCKLSWYMSQCVRNRMVDLYSVKKRKKIPTLYYYNTIEEYSELGLEVSRETTFNHFTCLEFDNFCQKMLTDKEYTLFQEYYVFGYTYEEIMNNFKAGISMIKSPSLTKKDIRECLLLIMRKLELKEVNPQLRKS
jgi:RNA polymerase sigma factor (sigma-70 family)